MVDLREGERAVRVANGVKVGVEDIGQLTFMLSSGFTLNLIYVIFVHWMRRNLISV